MYSGFMLFNLHPTKSNAQASLKKDSAHVEDSTGSSTWTNKMVPDLSFLSNNFSSDSINVYDSSTKTAFLDDLGLSNASAGDRPLGNHSMEGRKVSITPTDVNSPRLSSSPVIQASAQHRTRTSNYSDLPRPKSLYVGDAMNFALSEENANMSLLKSEKRNSFQYLDRSIYTPHLSPQQSEHRKPRSRSTSPIRSRSSRRGSQSPVRNIASTRGGSPVRTPFNFKPQDISQGSNSSLVVKPAHRKGHRYKHSSVSMNFFQEPASIADPVLQQNLVPHLYPMPNITESWASADTVQRYNVFLAFSHFVMSIAVYVSGTMIGEAAFSTLSHLVFYDSLGSFVLATVTILSNFDVWKKPSITYPFGIGRLEVLMGFGLSTSLVMVGCDLISHFIEELIVKLAVVEAADSTDHGSHHIHESGDKHNSFVLYEVILSLVLVITWLTSSFIIDSGKLYKMMVGTDYTKTKPQLKSSEGVLNFLEHNGPLFRERAIAFLAALVKNPMRIITLSYTTFLMLSPLAPKALVNDFNFDVDEASTLVVAFTLSYAGWKLVSTLGGILLISFPYTEYDYSVLKSTVIEHIMDLESFKTSYSLSHLHIAKVDYQMYVAGVKVAMEGGSADDESRLLFELDRIFRNAMEAFERDSFVETTIDIERV